MLETKSAILKGSLTIHKSRQQQLESVSVLRTSLLEDFISKHLCAPPINYISCNLLENMARCSTLPLDYPLWHNEADN